MRTIFSRVKLKTSSILLVVMFMLFTSVAEMLLPTLFAKMIDQGVAVNNTSIIWQKAIAMAIIALAAGACWIVSNRIAAGIVTHFSADLRTKIFHQVQGFSAPELDKFGTASLVSRSTADVTNLQYFMSYVLNFGLNAPLVAIAGLVLTAMTGGKVGVVLVVAIPLLLIVCSVIVSIIIRYTNKLRKKMDDLNLLFLEALEGVRVIRAFNKQGHEQERFAKENAEYAKTQQGSSRVIGLLVPSVQILFGLTTTAVMGLGAYYVYNGELAVGTLSANIQYVNMILYSVILFTLVLVYFPTAYTCAKRIEEVLKTESSIVDGNYVLDAKKSKGVVEFQDVTFAYPGAENPVLKNVSFTAKPGEFVAIIGRTGSGKSSLIKLIPRCYDVTFGKVLVDGVDVRDYKQKELRSIIGYVPQKNVLFSGDIASNLNFGNEKGSDKDWKEAADIACASEFIEKKDKTYHDFIAQGGTNLSGGQRQRMAIARAVMKKPKIYIFDDSFSALDVKTDRVLRSNIRKKCSDATVVMVAQRISSVTDADRILVLENNQVVGMGKHKELLKSCKLYREIAVLQMGEEAVKREEA